MFGKGHPLPAALEAACLLQIQEIRRKGGITDFDIDEIRRFSDVLGEKGDIVLYRSPTRGDTAKLFNMLARVVAVGAFMPGGITVFDMHFEESALE